MSLDPRLWQRLQDHGLTTEHLELLASILELQRTGNVTWNYMNGQVMQTDVRLNLPARSRELARVGDVLVQAVPPVGRKRP
jgi:hypothetical protein